MSGTFLVFCLIINKVAPAVAIGFHHIRSFQLITLKSQNTYIPESYWLVTDRWLSRSLEGQFHPR
jgi:hypothetical protein